jgi:hypothetical protein
VNNYRKKKLSPRFYTGVLHTNKRWLCSFHYKKKNEW